MISKTVRNLSNDRHGRVGSLERFGTVPTNQNGCVRRFGAVWKGPEMFGNGLERLGAVPSGLRGVRHGCKTAVFGGNRSPSGSYGSVGRTTPQIVADHAKVERL